MFLKIDSELFFSFHFIAVHVQFFRSLQLYFRKLSSVIRHCFSNIFHITWYAIAILLLQICL
jgi:hypothetical protein